MANSGGFVVGKSLNYGFPGQRSRGLGDVVENRAFRATDTGAITFGAPVALNPDNTYSAFGTLATTLSTALTSTTAYTTLAVPALTEAVDAGDTVILVSTTNSQATTVTTAAAIGATSLTVASFTASYSFPIGTFVYISNAFSQFAGVAVREVKQSTVYFGGGTAQYNPGDPTDVIQQGSVIVTCNVGTPTAGGKVYVRIIANVSIPLGIVGGFEAAADGQNTVQITNAQWKTGLMDSNNSAEITLLTRNNA